VRIDFWDVVGVALLTGALWGAIFGGLIGSIKAIAISGVLFMAAFVVFVVGEWAARRR